MKCMSNMPRDIQSKINSQRQGIDYDEVLVLGTRLETIWLIIFLVAYKKWKIYQTYVKYVFLKGHLEEEVYVE